MGAPKDQMYLLLHRALRNAGDSLIFERAKALLEAFRPDEAFVIAEGWRPLRDQLPVATIQAARAVIVAGGPGYGNGIEHRYPLGLDPATDPPLVLLALGSAVVPGTDRQLAAFRFDPASKAFLDGIAARSPWLGARDDVTAGLLHDLGFENVLMTGDPAWYDLAVADAPSARPDRVDRLAFTPPAGPIFFAQAVRLAKALRRAYPDAAGLIVHHRGVQRPFERLARELGWSTVDITGGAAGFAHYDEVDLHVGYRVHAHLYRLSHGRPSWLVAEDSRGVGMLRTLGPLGIAGFADHDDGAIQRAAMRHLPRVANAYRPGFERLGLPAARLLGLPDIGDDLVARIAADRAAGHPLVVAAVERIGATLPTMRRMIEALP
jgi:hypothetical protein